MSKASAAEFVCEPYTSETRPRRHSGETKTTTVSIAIYSEIIASLIAKVEIRGETSCSQKNINTGDNALH